MLVHKKHLALDAMVHSLLGSTMMVGSAAIILELRSPDNFLLSALRSFALCIQGLWMITVNIHTCDKPIPLKEDFTKQGVPK